VPSQTKPRSSRRLAAGLGVRDERLAADPTPGRDAGADAVGLALLAEVAAPLPGGQRDVDRRVEREQAHRAVAAVDQRADVAGALAVAADELEGRLAQLLRRVRDVHVVQRGGLEQPVDVLLVAEHRGALGLGVVAADALEDPGAVVQPVGEHVDLRVLPRDELAVHPDEVRCVHACLLRD
jgi:hypothetical protein